MAEGSRQASRGALVNTEPSCSVGCTWLSATARKNLEISPRDAMLELRRGTARICRFIPAHAKLPTIRPQAIRLLEWDGRGWPTALRARALEGAAWKRKRAVNHGQFAATDNTEYRAYRADVSPTSELGGDFA